MPKLRDKTAFPLDRITTFRTKPPTNPRVADKFTNMQFTPRGGVKPFILRPGNKRP